MIPYQEIVPFNKLVSLIGNTIYVQAHKLVDRRFDELLFDLFSDYYTGQKIVIVAGDGENVVRCGLVNFFDDLCNKGVVPRDSVTFISHNMHWDSNFKHEKMALGPWFTGLKDYLKNNGNFATANNDAKFVGCLIGRFSPSRFKLAYQLDHAFPSDNFLTFRSNGDHIHRLYSMIDMGDAYKDQLDWIQNKKFDVDPNLPTPRPDLPYIDWRTFCQEYHNLWPKYLIECVAESDSFSNSFLTEKIAKCIVSAKPFLIVAGKGSLKTLQTFGFKTYDSVIDESYDLETTTNSRITAIIRSLTELYHSPNRQFKISQMNEIAKHNQQIYDQICRKIQLPANS